MSYVACTQFDGTHGRLLLAVQLEPKEIGQRLQAARKRKGHTQLSFALEANVSPGTVARWESGRLPPVRELVRIAELLEIDPAELVEDEVGPSDQGPSLAGFDSDELEQLMERAARKAVTEVIHDVQFPRLDAIEAALPGPSPVTDLIERAVRLLQTDDPRSEETSAAAVLLAGELRSVSSELARLADDIEAPQSARRRR